MLSQRKRWTNPIVWHYLTRLVRLHARGLVCSLLAIHWRRLTIWIHWASRHPAILVIYALSAIVDGGTMAFDRRSPVVLAVVSTRGRCWITCESRRGRRDLHWLAIWRSRRNRLRELVRTRCRAFPVQGGSTIKAPSFNISRQWLVVQRSSCATYIIVRGSLRMRNFTPWSAKDRERKVDSIMPGKFFGGDTLNRSEISVFK
jgi:hypothetical protein